MGYYNHWIPAFAGMTGGLRLGFFSGMAKGLSGWRQTHFNLRRHSSVGWNPGNGGAVMNRRLILADGALGGHPFSGHSRSAGMDCLNHWIPAFAGMTEGLRSGICRE